MTKIQYSGLNNYLKKEYGCKVYKVSLNGGFTCPNRDGKLDTRGCIFCSKGGSGEFASDKNLSIHEQLNQGIEKIRAKLPEGEEVGFIAYFQAFTNTYGPIDKMQKLFYEAINDEKVKVLSIATRPDCLEDEVLDLLDRLNKIKPVWVELGLQTIHKESAEYIRRGYALEVYDRAVLRLKALGIRVITHIIVGLPGEDISKILESVSYVAGTKTFGIKLSMLHVLKDTDLQTEYEKGMFKTLEMDEYIDIIKKCLEIIPKDMIVHRITGDGDKKLLLAPMWSADKKRVLNEMNKWIEAM